MSGERMSPEQHRAIRRGETIPGTMPFYIVMSLDKPGPCERGERPYFKHETYESAQKEARRLSASCGSGRFAVLTTVYLVG